jgi:hypothetical protein
MATNLKYIVAGTQGRQAHWVRLVYLAESSIFRLALYIEQGFRVQSLDPSVVTGPRGSTSALLIKASQGLQRLRGVGPGFERAATPAIQPDRP